MPWFFLSAADNKGVLARKTALVYIGRNCFHQLKVSDLISTVALWHLESVLCKETACPLLAGRAFQVCTAPTSALLASRSRSMDLAHILVH